LLFSGKIAIFRANFVRPPNKMISRTPMNICTRIQHSRSGVLKLLVLWSPWRDWP